MALISMGVSPNCKVGVVGAGAMGAGIAQVAAITGHPVALYDVAPGSARAAKDKMSAALARLVEKGRLSAEEQETALARVSPVASLDELSGAGLVIEAVVEDLAIKQDLFAALETLVSESAILATNTSSLSITEIARLLKRPQRFAGLHFFNPAPVMALVEVVSGERTAPEVRDALVELAQSWGKKPVRVQDSPGFVVNRGARPFYGEALRFLDEGGSDAATVDALLRSSGFKMGPLELIDMIGLDVNLAATRRIYEATGRNPRYKPSPLQERMVSAGLLGRKSGEGFHRYGGSPSERMEAHADTEVPNTITVQGDLGPAQPLVGLWNERGLEVKQESGPGQVLAGQAVLRLTRGRRVSERNMVLLDLSLDYAQAETVALAAADEGLDDAVGLFQAIGKKVCVVKDLPGMLVARTVCMLINEAMDSLHRGIATREDIEMAMKLGLNFPGGPFEWLERLGAPYVLSVLQGVRDATGDPRYEPSPLLRSRAEAAHA